MTSLAPGPMKGYCECAQETCGEFGSLKKPDRWGRRHVRGCPCKRCQGARNRRKGDSKAAKARRTLGLAGPLTRHEEHWRGVVLTEVKAGAKAKPVETFYRNARNQSDASRAQGDTRPFVAIAAPDGTGRMLAVLDLSDLATILEAL